MIRRVVFRPEAEADLLDARAWYDRRRDGLGQDFVLAVATTLLGITDNPLAFPEVRHEIRRAIIARFPYGVYFSVTPGELVVLAITHGRRHPRVWRGRG